MSGEPGYCGQVDPALVEGTRAADQQAALLRVATLVAEGAPEALIAAAVTSEIGLLFEAERANTMRWDGDHLRVIGSWHADGSSEAVGLVLAFGAAGAMSNLVFGVTPRDAISLLSATGLLLLVAVAASYIPARRAGAVDPGITLRAE